MAAESTPVTLAQLIDRLSPAPAPPPVPWLPQTWGWALLAGLILAMLAGWAWRARRRHRANAYRRRALAELAASDQRIESLAEILRRTALAAFPRERVAGLHGDAWRHFLDAHYPGEGFSGPLGAALVRGPYRGGPAPPELSVLVAEWIRRHRTDGDEDRREAAT
ncbi:DUF4381 domain-containing protein [Halomonas sp. 1390]|uniref:DUF4381 domain-containing protein n=1 Tax=Halomonas sp. B23F22_3 TaxID=3459516 RepID=UPI00373E2688